MFSKSTDKIFHLWLRINEMSMFYFENWILPIVVSLPMLLTDLGYKNNGGNILNKSGF